MQANINEQGGRIKLSNSAMDAGGYNLGAGWIQDDTVVALAYGRMNSEYGLPGEDGVFIKLKQDRYQGVVDWNNLDGFINAVHWQNAYTDYEHSEIDVAEVGTTLKNESIESRLWGEHASVFGWKGVLGLHYNNTDFEAIGDEAFRPPTKTTSVAVFLMEERQTGVFIRQMGSRIEQVTHTVNNDYFAERGSQQNIAFADTDYVALSGSAGVVFKIDSDNTLAFDYAYCDRAPSASEFFGMGCT